MGHTPNMVDPRHNSYGERRKPPSSLDERLCPTFEDPHRAWAIL